MARKVMAEQGILADLVCVLVAVEPCASFTVFTDPELATVGLTEAQANERDGDVATGTYDYKLDSRARSSGRPRGS